MPRFDLVVESKLQRSVRCAQLEGMFDVPPHEKLRHEWNVDVPIESDDWSVGLIVGPSGCGKTQIARRMFGELVDAPMTWTDRAVIDDFDARLSIEDVSAACMAVGFNTIPSWMKPHAVLSNGEKFRAELARRLIEGGDLIVVDEFSSVVDRQVAKIASHAVQKFVRGHAGKKFVAVTCHYDVIEWLRPDWIYDPSTRKFARGCLQQRPKLNTVVGPIPYAAWEVFAPFHYLTAKLHRSARCWGLWLDGRLASFVGVLGRPLSGGASRANPQGLIGFSRGVTLPDFQGLGLVFVLMDAVASVYAAVGKTVHTYPAHPALIRAFDRSPKWEMRKRPGLFSSAQHSQNSVMRKPRKNAPAGTLAGNEGGRPCAVFRYHGPAIDIDKARGLLEFWSRNAGRASAISAST